MNPFDKAIITDLGTDENKLKLTENEKKVTYFKMFSQCREMVKKNDIKVK